MEQVFFADTCRHTMASSCFNIYLRPAVVVQNTLPVDLIVSPQGIQKPIDHLVKPGETLHLPQVQPGETIVVLMVRYIFD
jgi:vacuolar protein sorting-associated protein 13A/C